MIRWIARLRPWVFAVLLFGSCLMASCGGDDGTAPVDPAPVCQITPTALVFDTVTVGQTLDRTFTIKNTGGGTLTGSAIESCAAFSIESGGGGYSLTASQAETVTVRFAPTGAGSLSCTVTLGATACGSVDCSGTGKEPPPATGSCCALAGTCTVTTQAICPDTWTSGRVCTPNPCSGPPSDMVLIPAGTFTMGSPTDEPGRRSNETQHQVTLTRAFYVSIHEETQAEWQAVMGWNESGLLGADRPVETVTWYDAVSYCNQRSTSEGYAPAYSIANARYIGNHIRDATVTWDQAANGYRLLTEAEWEYACRATSTSAFCNGGIRNTGCSPVDPNLDQVGWYCGNTDTTHDCGRKTANAWGLEDMHGNVYEWCWDRYADYPTDAAWDPSGPPPAPGSGCLIRGGCLFNSAFYCRSASRSAAYRSDCVYYIGFRIARNSS